MNSALGELVDLVKPPLRPPSNADRQAAEAIYGAHLPPDFLEYVATFPAGSYQTYLRVFHVAEYGSTEDLTVVLGLFGDLLRDGAARSGRAVVVHPEPGGLLPWAGIGRDWIICWSTTDPDPGQWTVVVCDPFEDEWYPYAGSATAFLRDFVLGRTGIDELSYIYEDNPAPLFATAPHEPSEPRPAAQVYPDGLARLAETVGEFVPPVDASADLHSALGAQVTARPAVDWLDVAARLGSPVPNDYQRLIDGGVPERIGPVRLALPGGAGESDLVGLANLVHARALAAHESTGGFREPYHPEPGGLVPWAIADNGAVLCWCPLGDDSNLWPVTVVAATFRANATYSMTATRLLLRLVTEPGLITLL